MDLMTGMSIARTIGEGLSAYFTLKTESERLTAELALQKQLGDLYGVMSALSDTAEKHRRAQREAEDELARLRQQLQSFQGYEPRALPSGAIVYSFQPPAGSQEPSHYACARCWDADQKKARLQPIPGQGHALVCPVCKHTYPLHPADTWDGAAAIAADRRRRFNPLA